MVNPTLIKDCGYEWPANARRILNVPVTLPSGRTLSDWASFTLTIREDPGWPRSGTTLFIPLDPANAGGTPLLTVAGTASPDGSAMIVFDFTVPANPGRHRYAFDVWAIGGVAGNSPLVEATWVTVLPSVR